MWLDDMALHLRSQQVEGLPQDEVYVHTLPHDTPVGIMFASGYQGMPIDAELPGYHKGPMQMIARAKSSLQAETIAYRASEQMKLENQQVGDIFVNYIRPRHLPVAYPSSKGDFYEASVNFDVCFVREIG